MGAAALATVFALFAPVFFYDMGKDRAFARAWVAAVRRGDDTTARETFVLHASDHSSLAAREVVRRAAAVEVPWWGDTGSSSSCWNGTANDGGRARSLAVIVEHRHGTTTVAEVDVDTRCGCQPRSPCRMIR